MVSPGLSGFNSSVLDKASVRYDGDEKLDEMLKNPTSLRIFAIARALEKGYSVDKLHSLTRIDKWFLAKLHNISRMSVQLQSIDNGLYGITKPMMKKLKLAGFSDLNIAELCNTDEI